MMVVIFLGSAWSCCHRTKPGPQVSRNRVYQRQGHEARGVRGPRQGDHTKCPTLCWVWLHNGARCDSGQRVLCQARPQVYHRMPYSKYTSHEQLMLLSFMYCNPSIGDNLWRFHQCSCYVILSVWVPWDYPNRITYDRFWWNLACRHNLSD